MKKAILYIDSMQRGGAQRVMSVLSKFLSDRGIYTVLVNDIIPEEGKAEYSVDSRVHRVFLDKNTKPGKSKNIARVNWSKKISEKGKSRCHPFVYGTTKLSNVVGHYWSAMPKSCLCKK